MLYGISINGVDMLEKYGLCLLADAVIPAPSPRETRYTVPGMDGSIDASRALTGEPVFDDVEITFTLFAGKPDAELSSIRTELLNSYHGQRVKVVFPPDATHYRMGTLKIGTVSEYNGGRIPVTMLADPWRYKLTPTTVARSDLGTAYKQLSLPNERRPVIPTITVEQATTLLWGGSTITLSAGTYRRADICLAAGINILKAKVASGTGTISVEYQEAEPIMYRLTYEDYILYDPRLATPEDRLIIRDPKVHLAVDKAGEMSFLLQPEHPYVDKIRKMSGVVELTDGATPIYRGRITRDTIDFYGVHTVETEGLLACLNDSIIEPFAYPEDFTEDAGYQEAAAAGNVVEYLFRWLLAQHNAQVSTEQQLKPGTCTVTDPNNYITRSSTDYQTTMEAIRSKLFGSSLGGHLLIRYETDGNYLDYYADLPLTNTQPVEFAANLLDLTAELDGTDIYTAILPLGKDGLTIAELSDADLTDDLVKSGKIIYSKSGIAAHGRITRCIKWDDVTVPANLQTKAKAALADNGLAMPETITVRAVDLGWQDAVQHFRIGLHDIVGQHAAWIQSLVPIAGAVTGYSGPRQHADYHGGYKSHLHRDTDRCSAEGRGKRRASPH